MTNKPTDRTTTAVPTENPRPSGGEQTPTRIWSVSLKSRHQLPRGFRRLRPKVTPISDAATLRELNSQLVEGLRLYLLSNNQKRLAMFGKAKTTPSEPIGDLQRASTRQLQPLAQPGSTRTRSRRRLSRGEMPIGTTSPRRSLRMLPSFLHPRPKPRNSLRSGNVSSRTTGNKAPMSPSPRDRRWCVLRSAPLSP